MGGAAFIADDQGDQWKWLARGFPETKWTALRQIHGQVAAVRPVMWETEDFCRAYWYPLYAFLRRRGYGAEDAQDHVQSFFAGVVQAGGLAKADESRGKLRHFLMMLVTRHAAGRHAKSRAVKRGGGVEHVSMDWAGAEQAFVLQNLQSLTPEDACRQALAAQLVQWSLAEVEADYGSRGKELLFKELLPCLEGPLREGTYGEIAERLGMRDGAVRMAVVRLRDRFRQSLRSRAAVLLSLEEGPQLDQEILHLLCADSRPSGV